MTPPPLPKFVSGLLLAGLLAAATPPVAFAMPFVIIESQVAEVRNLGPVDLQVPVVFEIADAPIDLGAFNLVINATSQNPGNTITLNGALPGNVFSPDHLIFLTGSPLGDLLISDFGLADVTLPVGQHLLTTLDITVDVTHSGGFTLELDPLIVQLTNASGAIGGVWLTSGEITQPPRIIPEPASAAVCLVLSLLVARRTPRPMNI